MNGIKENNCPNCGLRQFCSGPIYQRDFSSDLARLSIAGDMNNTLFTDAGKCKAILNSLDKPDPDPQIFLGTSPGYDEYMY